MQVTDTPVAGLKIITPKVFGDARGYFFEVWNRQAFHAAGLDYEFVQDNESCSMKGVIRGLHYQAPPFTQAKLVRVIRGAVFDVAVDIRKGSPTFGKWVGEILTGENKKQLLIPRGFAHGFLCLEDHSVFAYKCDALYAPQADCGIQWNDPAIGIVWPAVDVPLQFSEKDKHHPLLNEIEGV